MTIINNSFRFIFVHVPKSAGTSLTSVLEPYTNYCDLEIGGTNFGEQIQPAYNKRFGLAKHSTATAIRGVVGAVTWSQYFSFAFVRNPFARCISTYHFLRKWEGVDSEFAIKMKQFKSFDEFVLSDTWLESNGPDDIFRPQTYWLKTPGKHEVLVDFVGHVERINEDMEFVMDVIGNSKMKKGLKTVPKLNQSKESSLSDIKNNAVIEKIVHKYKTDFDAFGYSRNPHAEANIAGMK